MGMAASQARLLSITTRLSDNELRSQLINNQKIRLATESSKASERYVAALNNTKMMYSAYDVKGNPLNKELTFANLTAYSSYNNQYGLRNLSGQILVSEETAHNYENAVKAAENNTETTALEEFLKSYNLEKGTTFFDGVTTDIIDACLGMPEGESSGLTGADLKAMYLGGADTQGVEHEGYDAILSGTEYNSNFEPLFTEYAETYDIYMKEMYDYIDIYNKDTLGLEALKGAVESTTDIGALKNHYNTFINAVNTAGGKGIQGSTYFADLVEYAEMTRDGLQPQATSRNGNTITVDGLFTLNIINSTAHTATVTAIDTSASYNFGGFDGTNYLVNQVFTDDDGNSATVVYYVPETSGDAYSKEDIDATTYQSTLIALISGYLQNSYEQFDLSKFELDQNNPDQKAAALARENFENAAKALSQYMFGGVVDKEEYQNLNDLTYLFARKENFTEGFTSVFDVLILDAVLNELGDPNVTWIDTTNPNEDATAKAQWYTNLFNRMQTVTTTEKDDGTITEEIKTNYQVLEDGLATSAEWLQFALESGLVSMEQVDANNNWCSTLYSNCSDITETTDANEATVAEAEYNATMAKIEAKDKQFDIQLKNIDTEHESLQTEYDSIKSVLDKNIERNFKMYSA